MSRLLGISIQNFGVLKNVRLGRLADDLDAEPLGAMTTFIGSNGVGKSTLVGVFEFLAYCFNFGVSAVCSVRNPGGFSHVRSQGSVDPIRFELLFQESPEGSLLTYQIALKSKDSFETCVYEEKLTQGVGDDEKVLFHVRNGEVLKYWLESDDSHWSNDGIKTVPASLGFGDEVPFLSFYSSFSVCSTKLLSFLKRSYLCRFSPEFMSKGRDSCFLEPYLNRTCGNLTNVAAYMRKTDPAALQRIDRSLQTKIPNFERIESETMKNGQHELAIYQKSSPDPLYSSNASDGTLKLFAYYLLLNEVEGTKPRRLICIEEPENGLYHTYLPDLAGDLAESASKGRQIFVTTHSPYFVNALFPKDVWVLSRGSDGFAQIRRASDFPSVNELFEEEIPLGDLWHNEYLEGEIR